MSEVSYHVMTLWSDTPCKHRVFVQPRPTSPACTAFFPRTCWPVMATDEVVRPSWAEVATGAVKPRGAVGLGISVPAGREAASVA